MRINKMKGGINIEDLPRKILENDPKYIVPIAYDDIFHQLFGTDKNIKVTTYLISAILNIPYKELLGHVRIKSPKGNKIKVKGKDSEKDIVVSIDIENPLRINIEMNKYNIANTTINRNIFYLSDLFTTGLKRKDIYKDLVTTIQINFNSRFVDKENEPLVDKYYYMNEYGNILTEKIQIYHINVAKMSDIWYNDSYRNYSNINPLIILLGAMIWETKKKEFKKIVHNKLMDKDVGKIIEEEVLEMNSKINFTPTYYDREESRRQEWEATLREEIKKSRQEGLTQGITQGISQGITQGISQGIAQTIVDFYNNGVSFDLIQKATGLKAEEINDIISHTTR